MLWTIRRRCQLGCLDALTEDLHPHVQSCFVAFPRLKTSSLRIGNALSDRSVEHDEVGVAGHPCAADWFADVDLHATVLEPFVGDPEVSLPQAGREFGKARCQSGVVNVRIDIRPGSDGQNVPPRWVWVIVAQCQSLQREGFVFTHGLHPS